MSSALAPVTTSTSQSRDLPPSSKQTGQYSWLKVSEFSDPVLKLLLAALQEAKMISDQIPVIKKRAIDYIDGKPNDFFNAHRVALMDAYGSLSIISAKGDFSSDNKAENFLLELSSEGKWLCLTVTRWSSTREFLGTSGQPVKAQTALDLLLSTDTQQIINFLSPPSQSETVPAKSDANKPTVSPSPAPGPAAATADMKMQSNAAALAAKK